MRNFTRRCATFWAVTKYGLLLLCLGMLSGCCKPCLPAQCVAPPKHLTSPTLLPLFEGTTNEDLLYWALELRQSAIQCNLDKLATHSLLHKEDGQ